jgi:hypothetical protein
VKAGRIWTEELVEDPKAPKAELLKTLGIEKVASKALWWPQALGFL